MRIIAFVPGGINEQILFFPALDSLKQSYPNAEIDVVVEPRAKAAYSLSKSVDDVLAFDYPDRNSPADWANLLGVVRDRYYTAAIYTGQGWGVGMLLWLTGVPKRICYDNSAGKLFYTNVVPFKPDQYTAYAYHDLLQGLNINVSCPELSLTVPKADLDWADGERKRLGIGNSGYVLLQADSEQSETYPIESWKEIVQSFRDRQPDIPLVLAQTAGEPAAIVPLTQAYPDLKVTRPANLGKLAAMIAGANLVVGASGVPMQLAVALKVYTLALFGSKTAATLLPKSDKFSAIQSSTGKLADIPPAQVLEKVWGG
ncbi:glycosyltransferase family 9 protein [Phormidium tenue FACHB-886]|nr:glycosyltransferase family 9 protein [Phormidium tenue FACHB-886]